MMNGIPLLASTRGALPKTVGSGGFLLDIPDLYQPDTTVAPTAEEVAPWVDLIIDLWDNESLYHHASMRALAHAERRSLDKIAPLYEAFFKSVTDQPGPPFVPKGTV
jgi:glycosyltransferase involved in cell wall biosynthesis